MSALAKSNRWRSRVVLSRFSTQTVVATLAAAIAFTLVLFSSVESPQSLDAGLETTQIATPQPPKPIATIIPVTDRYLPELEFVYPTAGITVDRTTVPLELNVKKLPVAQDPKTGLGFHISVIVDNEEPIQYFDLDRPLDLQLSPGTHTIRAVATRPWGQPTGVSKPTTW